MEKLPNFDQNLLEKLLNFVIDILSFMFDMAFICRANMDIYLLDFSTPREESFRSSLPPPSPPWLNRSNIDFIIIRRRSHRLIVMASCPQKIEKWT